jgi:hypothetical protein
MITYEKQLSQNIEWALREGSMHFEEKSAVHSALEEIARRLDELEIPYAIADDMALFAHGLRRFTEDVDVLVTPDGLRALHTALEGKGYVPPFTGSKNLRDTENGVRIEFLVTGEYPGDGKPKPVAFPDPSEVGTEIGGIRYLHLPRLVELKLASGMTNPGRLKDLADVQELIRILHLPAEFADELDKSVQEKYKDLWVGLQG